MKRIGRLVLLTDSSLQDRWSHLELAAQACAGGAQTIQYRRKNASTLVMLREASAMREICRRHGVPLIVNDRLDVALAADAEGVHLGDQDLPIPLARRFLGPHRWIGGSADNAVEAGERQRDGADYVGIGPVFVTSSKSDAGPALGLKALAEIARAATVPLIAIGGITLENLSAVLATGVFGVAVLSAFCRADDPAEAAAALRKVIDQAHPQSG
jgi:thiamine-phosphate pyrophosphorylase